MKIYTLYVHEFPNHKLYIGITCDTIQHRWRNNGYGYKSQRLMCRAIQKYRWDNIKHIILLENLSKAYISAQLSDAIVFSLLIIMLLIKPSGILGKTNIEKV